MNEGRWYYAENGESVGPFPWSRLLDLSNAKLIKLLRSHGVPEYILEQASKVGRDDLMYIPAATLVDAGAIKGLVVESSIVKMGTKGDPR
jgi:hypothetical protein